MPIRDKIINICQKQKDKQSEEIHEKLLSIHDLIAAEGRHYNKCKQEFYSGSPTNTETLGRPKDLTRNENFSAVCECLEAEAEIHTLSEVYKKMLDIAVSEECAYPQKWLKKKLEDKYSHQIRFVEFGENATKVCLRNMVYYLVKEEWYNQRMSDAKDKADRVIKTAATRIIENLRLVKFENEFYQAKDSMGDVTANNEWLPLYLGKMMTYLVKIPLKQASLCQGIIQAARPRSCLRPTLLGNGVDVDHVLDSRWLLDYLSCFGVSVSYDEINRFKQSVLKTTQMKLKWMEEHSLNGQLIM